MARAEAGPVVVHDVREGQQARPVDVFDAVNEDERERNGDQEEPQDEVIEERVVCGAGTSAVSIYTPQQARSAHGAPEVRGSVRPAKIMNTANHKM